MYADDGVGGARIHLSKELETLLGSIGLDTSKQKAKSEWIKWNFVMRRIN